MPTKKQQQICDSKVKHTELSAQHSINPGQGYYKCEACDGFHIYTIQKIKPKKQKINHKFKLRKLRRKDNLQ